MKKTSENSSGQTLFFRLGAVVEECKKEYKTICAAPSDDIAFSVTDDVSFPCETAKADSSASCETAKSTFSAAGHNGNLLALGDNLDFMRYLLLQNDMRGALRLIYIDPPFFSGTDYKASLSMGEKNKSHVHQQAYGDTWDEGLEEYLRMLTLRLLFMRDLLADDGVIWVHLDWHVSHYAKLILDELFGAQNFVNEVIWTYKSGGASSRHFARKHDTLLFYAKGDGYYFEPQKEKSYNRDFKPYRFKGVAEYKDELGWYTLVNRRDVWQFNMVGRTSAERTGYATQKPEALLETIIKSCTKEGDLCADFFSGSGTLAAAAGKLGRRFICCDAGNLAVSTAAGRIAGAGVPFLRGQILRGKAARDQMSALRTEALWKKDIKVQTGRENVKRVKLETVRTGYPNGGSPEEPEKIRLVLRRCGLPGRGADLSAVRREELKKLVQREPLALVRFWAVDPKFDGKVFRPRYFFCRDKAGLAAECEFSLSVQSGRKECRNQQRQPEHPAAVKVCDVFGEEMMIVLDSLL